MGKHEDYQDLRNHNMNYCPDCEEIKPTSEFYKSVTAPSGLRAYCKQCGKERARKWKYSNSTKAIEYRKRAKVLEENRRRLKGIAPRKVRVYIIKKVIYYSNGTNKEFLKKI